MKTLTESRFGIALECPTKLYYYGKKDEMKLVSKMPKVSQ
jgi:hypothetical protein